MKFLIVFLTALATADARFYQHNVNELQSRITNGQNDQPGNTPFQVLLLLQDLYLCGASILSERHFLTAAHCTDGITFGVGIIGATDISEAAASIRREFSQKDIIIHPDWNYSQAKNDISIIKVIKFTFSKLIQPVKLATTISDLVGEIVTATGWGRTSDFSQIPKILQTVDLEVTNSTDCSDYYGSMFTDMMICVSTVGGKSTCNGDSGGPLVKKSTKEQIGIVSYGASAGCTKEIPAVFTCVPCFVPWIESALINSTAL